MALVPARFLPLAKCFARTRFFNNVRNAVIDSPIALTMLEVVNGKVPGGSVVGEDCNSHSRSNVALFPVGKEVLDIVLRPQDVVEEIEIHWQEYFVEHIDNFG